MFTLANFIKFLIVLSLTIGSSTFPVIGDIGSLLGDGLSGTIAGYAVLFVFWWFVTQQVFSFFGFAFGGGVGRYHTTKLYRRMQWVAFHLITSTPLLVAAFLGLNASPLSVEPPEYRAAYERIKAQRLAAAKSAQHQQIEKAVLRRKADIQTARSERSAKLRAAINERQSRIDAARRARQINIDQAQKERSRKINATRAERNRAIQAARAERQRAIDEATRKRQNGLDAVKNDRNRLEQARAERKRNIQGARRDRQAKIEAARDKRLAAYQSALRKRNSKIQDEWGLLAQKKERALRPHERTLRNYRTVRRQRTKQLKNLSKNRGLISDISNLLLEMALSKNLEIRKSFADSVSDTIFDYERYKSLLANGCASGDEKIVLTCELIKEIRIIGANKTSKYLKRFSKNYMQMFHLQNRIKPIEHAENKISQAKDAIARIDAEYDPQHQRIKDRYREPQLSDFPPVNMTQFPDVDESDFPKVDESRFPLAKLPDPPKIDMSRFPSVDMKRFPPVDMTRFPAIGTAQFPEIDERQYPPVDMSQFPPVEESSFPAVDPQDFPLRIDNSPIELASGSFEQRIEPTYYAHGWWFVPAVLILWIIFVRWGRRGFSFLYSRIMRFLDEGRFGFGGSARFASMLEEWGKPYKGGTLYVGRSLFNPFDEIGLGGEAHMLTVAGSRGGKGTAAIIPNLLLWEGSAVVIDPKGTNAHVTANARRAMGQDVHIIDPFGIVTKESARFDPLERINPEDDLVRERIASIADALVIPDEHAKEQHWDDGAKTIISGLIAQVISQKAEVKHLYEIRDLITQLPDEQDSLWADMAFNEGGGGYAKDAAMRYIRGSRTNEILGIMSNADKHTEWLSSPVMRKITSDPSFSITDIKKRPTTIYLVIPPRQLERQNRLLRLFINLVIDAMEDGGRSKTPVLMIMDEFLALGKMPEISNAFATMASYNLILWPFVQELEKLQSLYGGSFNSFIANSRAVQVFATSDQKTKEYISERLGNRPLSGLSNIAKSNDNLPLRAPNDVEIDLAAEERRQYIIEAGKSAMLLEKVPYHLGSRFKGKYDPDPDFLAE